MQLYALKKKHFLDSQGARFTRSRRTFSTAGYDVHKQHLHLSLELFDISVQCSAFMPFISRFPRVHP